jgi:hypothetical protein
VLRKIEILRNFADRPKRLWSLRHD